jgi:hypothetical protein
VGEKGDREKRKDGNMEQVKGEQDRLWKEKKKERKAEEDDRESTKRGQNARKGEGIRKKNEKGMD